MLNKKNRKRNFTVLIRCRKNGRLLRSGVFYFQSFPLIFFEIYKIEKMLAIVIQVTTKVVFIISFSLRGAIPEQSVSINSAVKRQKNIPKEFWREIK